MVPPRVSRTSAPRTCRKSRALQSAPGQGSGRRALAGENRLLRVSYNKIVWNSPQGKCGPGGAVSAPPVRLRSAFDDDEVFRVGPEARRVRDLYRVPGELAVMVGRRLELLVERVDRLLLIVDHALQVLHRRRQVVAQAVGDRGELFNPVFALFETRLELSHAGRHVADLLDERVARRPQRRLGGDLEGPPRNVDLRDLPAHLAHETRVLRHFLHQAIALARRLRQAVDTRLYLR